MSSLVAYTSSTSGEEEDDSEGAEEVVSHSQVSASTCEGGKDSSSFIDEANAEVTTSIAGQPEAMESTIECERKVGGARWPYVTLPGKMNCYTRINRSHHRQL